MEKHVLHKQSEYYSIAHARTLCHAATVLASPLGRVRPVLESRELQPEWPGNAQEDAMTLFILLHEHLDIVHPYPFYADSRLLPKPVGEEDDQTNDLLSLAEDLAVPFNKREGDTLTLTGPFEAIPMWSPPIAI